MDSEEEFSREEVNDSRRNTFGEDAKRTIMVSNDGFSKLIFLRRTIVDTDCTCEKIRRLVNSVNEEI